MTDKLQNPSSGSNIYAYKINFTTNVTSQALGFPITIQEGIGNSPCVDDIDNDRKNELIVTTGGHFYVWNSQGADSNNVYGWTSYRHDNYNSGVFNNMAGSFSYGNDFIIQDETISATSNNKRYFFGKNIKAGATIVLPRPAGFVFKKKK